MFPLVYMPHLQYVPPEVILSIIIISCSLLYNLPAEIVKLLYIQEVLSIPENLSLYKYGDFTEGVSYRKMINTVSFMKCVNDNIFF